MATYTASAAQTTVQARFAVEGVVQAVSRYSSSATLAASDIIEMVKVPIGACIHDIIVDYNPGDGWVGTGSPILSVGDQGMVDRFMSIGLQTAAISNVSAEIFNPVIGRLQSNVGYEYSIADTIDITLSGTDGTGSVGAVLNMSVLYSCNIPGNISGGEGTSQGAYTPLHQNLSHPASA